MKKLALVFIMLLTVSQGMTAEACAPLNDYKDNNDGTLTDLHDGLVWQRCAVGQKWNGYNCIEAAEYHTWFESMLLAKENRFLGFSDWRLPTKTEFQALMEKIEHCPISDGSYGPDDLPDLFSRYRNGVGFWAITPANVDDAYVPLRNRGGKGLVASFYASEFNPMQFIYSSRAEKTYFGSNKKGDGVGAVRLVRAGRPDMIEIERENQRVTQFQNDLNEAEKKRADEQAAFLIFIERANERAKKLEVCQKTDQYQLYQKRYLIAIDIENAQDSSRRAQEEISRQRQAAKFSGYVNNQVMYEMGQRIAHTAQLNKERFPAYKKLGGKAKNVGAVHSATEVDPCKM